LLSIRQDISLEVYEKLNAYQRLKLMLRYLCATNYAITLTTDINLISSVCTKDTVVAQLKDKVIPFLNRHPEVTHLSKNASL